MSREEPPMKGSHPCEPVSLDDRTVTLSRFNETFEEWEETDKPSTNPSHSDPALVVEEADK